MKLEMISSSSSQWSHYVWDWLAVIDRMMGLLIQYCMTFLSIWSWPKPLPPRVITLGRVDVCIMVPSCNPQANLILKVDHGMMGRWWCAQTDLFWASPGPRNPRYVGKRAQVPIVLHCFVEGRRFRIAEDSFRTLPIILFCLCWGTCGAWVRLVRPHLVPTDWREWNLNG